MQTPKKKKYFSTKCKFVTFCMAPYTNNPLSFARGIFSLCEGMYGQDYINSNREVAPLDSLAVTKCEQTIFTVTAHAWGSWEKEV